MPDRLIRDELLESERWLDLPRNTHRLAFLCLLLIVDDMGNGEAGTGVLWRAWAGPLALTDRKQIAEILAALLDAGLVVLYEAEPDKKRYLHIPKLRPHRQYLVQRHPLAPGQQPTDLGKRARALRKQGFARYQDIVAASSSDIAATAQQQSSDVAEGVGVGVGVGVNLKPTPSEIETAPVDRLGITFGANFDPVNKVQNRLLENLSQKHPIEPNETLAEYHQRLITIAASTIGKGKAP